MGQIKNLNYEQNEKCHRTHERIQDLAKVMLVSGLRPMPCKFIGLLMVRNMRLPDLNQTLLTKKTKIFYEEMTRHQTRKVSLTNKHLPMIQMIGFDCKQDVSILSRSILQRKMTFLKIFLLLTTRRLSMPPPLLLLLLMVISQLQGDELFQVRPRFKLTTVEHLQRRTTQRIFAQSWSNDAFLWKV